MASNSGASVPREVEPALRNGWRQKCPKCGQGPLYKAYLKVRESCPVCRQELFHHRADDGPAYVTILIVGHLVGAIALHGYTRWADHPVLLFVALAVLTVVLSLWLLPRIKGAIVAFQWAREMHGFSTPSARASSPASEGEA